MLVNNFIISVEAVLPMFIMMVIGVLVRKSGIMNKSEIKHLNRMVFDVFFSCMMFESLYTCDIKAAFDGTLIAFGATMVMVVYFMSVAVTLNVEKNRKTQGAMIQAIYRSNFVIMGLPIATEICGKENLGATAMMISIIVPMYNILAVITLEVFRGSKPNIFNIIWGVLKNPLIIGAILGISCVLAEIKLPHVLNTVVLDMSQVATPLALIVLGASFDFGSIRRSGKNLIIAVMGRLVMVPALVLTIAAVVGFRGIAFVTLIAIFAAPTAVSSFTMAERMDSDGELAGNCVIFSSMFACVTMFVWIFLFKTLGMF